jgi:hypothetical protein
VKPIGRFSIPGSPVFDTLKMWYPGKRSTRKQALETLMATVADFQPEIVVETLHDTTKT